MGLTGGAEGGGREGQRGAEGREGEGAGSWNHTCSKEEGKGTSVAKYQLRTMLLSFFPLKKQQTREEEEENGSKLYNMKEWSYFDRRQSFKVLSIASLKTLLTLL